MSSDKSFEFKQLTNIHAYFLNLLIMNLAWSAASFTYYMVGYYVKYIPGDMYMNVIISGIAEALITIFSGIFA